jgi:hypothetical protein
VYGRLLNAIQLAEPKIRKTNKKINNGLFYLEQKKKYNKRKKDLYQKMKNKKKYYDR